MTPEALKTFKRLQGFGRTCVDCMSNAHNITQHNHGGICGRQDWKDCEGHVNRKVDDIKTNIWLWEQSADHTALILEAARGVRHDPLAKWVYDLDILESVV